MKFATYRPGKKRSLRRWKKYRRRLVDFMHQQSKAIIGCAERWTEEGRGKDIEGSMRLAIEATKEWRKAKSRRHPGTWMDTLQASRNLLAHFEEVRT